jgi:heptosyltransferase-2
LHQSVYYLELVKGLGIPVTASEPSIIPRPATLARADALLASHGISAQAESGFGLTAGSQPIVGFAPGAAYGHAKRWPPRLGAETNLRLSRVAGLRCVLFGAGGDRDSGREIESSVPSGVGVVNLIGRTDLRVLAGAISRCAAFVSNDSGAMHLAAALGVPVVAVFGPTDERATSPLGGRGAAGAIVTPDVLTHAVFCRPCMLRDCPIDHRCMKGITVGAVVSAVTRRLPGAPAGVEARRKDRENREEVVT